MSVLLPGLLWSSGGEFTDQTATVDQQRNYSVITTLYTHIYNRVKKSSFSVRFPLWSPKGFCFFFLKERKPAVVARQCRRESVNQSKGSSCMEATWLISRAHVKVDRACDLQHKHEAAAVTCSVPLVTARLVLLLAPFHPGACCLQ